MNAELLSHQELLDRYQTVKQEVVAVKQENSYLKQQLEWFKKQIFGKKSERVIPPAPEQLVFFPELEPVQKEETSKVCSHERKRKPHVGDKIAVPADLPVEREVIDIHSEEKVCKATGEILVKIGEEITRKLAHKPGYFFIKEIVRPKYAAPSKDAGVEIAPLPSSILHRCYADESLLASVLIWKYADHIPLYRQEEILAREGVILPRQTLSKWVLRLGEALSPLYNEMKKRILSSETLFVDESPVAMQSAGKGSTTQAYMWILCGGKEAPYRAYHFSTNRKHENAEQLLKDYRGILHSDKYAAYQKLAEKKLLTWCPCFAHIRRLFFEAESGDQAFRNWVLRHLRYLFMLERVAWNRTPEERLKIRQEKEIPILDRLITAVKGRLVEGKILPKSKLREAMGYFTSLIPYLKNYTLHAEARLDNNTAERAVRPLAIGRKNWLFVGSEDGGEASAMIFSLVQSCRALNINPREYLEDIMRRLLDHPVSKLYELLPDHWAKAKAVLI